jgi:hypothetical protein
MSTISFKKECKGVVLERRGEDDNHICVRIVTQDDGSWFSSKESFSSYWIDELIIALQEAKKYIETQEPDIYDNRQYGWKFK